MKARLLYTVFACVIVVARTATAQTPAPSAAPQTSAPPVATASPAAPEPVVSPDAAKGPVTSGSTPAPASNGDKKPRYYYVDRFADLKVNPDHPVDWEWPGRNSINDFPVEPHDVFHLMDQVTTMVPGPDGKPVARLQPLQFNVEPGSYDPNNHDQRAIFGRNTWLLWCGGDEDFWDWLAQKAYGVLDFLQVVDSRKRSTRLADLGLINQPGLKSTCKPGPWGLYLDTVEKKIGEEGSYSPFPAGYDTDAFDYKDDQGRTLKSDGVNPLVYGYPSGVIGFRLFPNPNFDAEAKKRWNADAFYNDRAYAADPRTVRPFTVGMSCALCHVSIHPLNPPANAEEPQWSNLSSIIGAQYFRSRAVLGSRAERGNFLSHYLASQQPGCVDTSMTASDQINNANAMNAVFELPARMARAQLNPTEGQSAIAQTMPPAGEKDRRIARILMDGADSIGIQAALLRVYLNIGLFHDEWLKTSNALIGFAPQKPFSIDVCRRNSLYWRVNENFRIGYLADFFLWDKTSPTEFREQPGQPRFQCSTQQMSLADALVNSPEGKSVKFIETAAGKPHWDMDAAVRGGKVFTENCMVCHSSKQPEGYRIEFAHQPPGVKTWRELAADPAKLTMPYAWENWEDFKRSPAYADYVTKARPLTGEGSWDALRGFLADNYLSTDLRIPVTLTSTNSARAAGTNAMKGQVWGEFASKTYQSLPAVGKVSYTDPITKQDAVYEPPGNGPGYYRVPSLVSVWTCAPLLHNNALGHYIGDDEVDRRVSVAGRLEMFDDAVGKLLYRSKRGETPSGEGGLRGASDATWHGADPGWIYRTDVETELRIPSGDLRALIVGVLPGVVPAWMGPVVLKILDVPRLAPLALALLSLALFVWWPRGFFYLVVISGVLLTFVLAVTGLHYLLPWAVWLLPLTLLVGGLARIATKSTTGTPATLKSRQAAADAGDRTAVAAKRTDRLRIALLVVGWAGVAAYALLLLGTLLLLWTAHEFIGGNLGDLRVGPFPKGMPVNALMNMDPASPLPDRLGAVRGLCAMLGKLHAENAKERNSEEVRHLAKEKHPATQEEKLPPLYQFSEADRFKVFEEKAGAAVMKASKCPDFVLDRGHYFGESLTDQEKKDLIAFLKTL